MDFAELEKDTASRDEWLLMCRKQNVFSQMILIKDDIHYGQINSDFLQTTFFPFATFFVFEKELGISFSHNMDDECKKLIHRITPPSCIHNYPRHSGIYYNKRSNFPSLETPQARNKSGIQALHSTLFSM
ncbi:uncharacterized protein LOC103939967 isoform X2 [Pyrus x bretschneideri]|uniref:uncharacterized protein LOC103939967 isoform X2 n=1 Tax=Pyrus x bretschneideri TaxID=225117 RepID=UPI0020303DA3|nr:uncharacterized protein LOC103939967 isoform X2 [Pyrus x bretschneideri]